MLTPSPSIEPMIVKKTINRMKYGKKRSKIANLRSIRKEMNTSAKILPTTSLTIGCESKSNCARKPMPEAMIVTRKIKSSFSSNLL